jgi:predicted DNA-binding ribbon-helix-helix protein
MREKRMQPKNIYLSPKQWENLDKIASETGISVSELVRRIADRIIEEHDDKKFQRKLALLEAKAKSK